MKNETEFPKTLHAAIKYFADPDIALSFVVSMRWPQGVQCPRCGSKKVSFTAKRRVWTCEGCPNRRQFSVKVGTIMEDSPISLEKWLAGIWLVVSAKNGISSYELHRSLGITQKSAWFLGHRIRLALKNGTIEKLSGEVEADETFIGGLAKNMHKDEKRRKLNGSGADGKAIVMGILERKGRVIAKHVPTTRRDPLQSHIRNHVEHGSYVYTDTHHSYNGLHSHYAHEAINHAICYVRDNVHTNGLENFWALLKRTIKGTYVSVEPFHLSRYLDEQAFRFNERKGSDSERFVRAVTTISGRRLTYKGLTGNVAPA